MKRRAIPLIMVLVGFIGFLFPNWNYARAETVTIWDAWWSYESDVDGDGYISQVRLNWDPDVVDSPVQLSVFEKIYYKLKDSSTWTLFTTTAEHTINGTDTADVQYRTMEGGPHGEYDWKIEVYRTGESSADYARDDSNDSDLNDYKMEPALEDRVYTVMIVDAWWSDEVDADNDGYKRRARLNWHPVVGGIDQASVFEKIYYKLKSDSTWTLFTTTSHHTITDTAMANVQYRIIDGGSHGEYDWMIELYRSGLGSADSTRFPLNDDDLNDYKMETPAEDFAVTTISDAWWSDEVDADGDGYKSQARLNWDPDVVDNPGQLSVFEKIYYKLNSSSTWTLLATTSEHTIAGTDAADAQFRTISGGPHNEYDWKIEVYRSGQSSADYARDESNDSDLNYYRMETPAEDVILPHISSITPDKAPAGTDTSVAISGTNFGSSQGTSKVEFWYGHNPDRIEATDCIWSDTTIICKVPIAILNDYDASACSGPVSILTSNGRSNEVIFRVIFSYGGFRWVNSSGDPIVPYRINENTSDTAGEGAAVIAAANTWNAAGASLSFRYGGAHTNTTSSFDSSNQILWETTGSTYLAASYNWFEGSEMLECDIVFNDSYTWSTSSPPTAGAYDIQSIALHELGHWLNLRDLYGSIGDGEYDEAKVMYGYGNSGETKRNLHPDDVAGIQWIYGVSSVSSTIREAWWSNEVDADADGYKTRAQLNWDPDVAGGDGSLLVYEEIYYKGANSSSWSLYATTASHSITGTDSSDNQQVIITGLDRNAYDWRIVIYRSGGTSSDYTRDSSNDNDLQNCRLETDIQDTPGQGQLAVTISPPGAIAAGAQWRVDGGAWQNSEATVSELPLGQHTVGFKAVPCYNTPTTQNVTINAGQTTRTSGTYTLQIVTLKVTISPQGAIYAAAGWRVDGGAWQLSGTTLSGLSVGQHTIEFSPVPCYNTPVSQNVSLACGQAYSTSGTYTPQTGSLAVTISPQGAIAAGAQWRVNGGAWQNSGATVSGLPLGQHPVEFKDATGYDTPASRKMSVICGQTTFVTVQYSEYICTARNIYQFHSGWNLITLNCMPDPLYTARTLIEAINAAGGHVTKILRWDGGAWQSYSAGAPFGDFALEIGEGYFVLAQDACSWCNSCSLAGCLTYSLNNGWNLLGLPMREDLKASSLSQACLDEGGDVTKVLRWDGGAWRSYSVGAPFGDFDILPREGYFLLSTKESAFGICPLTESNVKDTQFTISWTSKTPEGGYIHYGTTTALGLTAYDDRGQAVQSTTHHVTITGLQANTTYYYEVVSGPSILNNGGFYFAVTTGPTVTPPMNIVTTAGYVYRSDGFTPAWGAIVYVTLKDMDGAGSPGQSALESCLTNSNGSWHLDLQNMRQTDLQNVFEFTADVDHIVVNVDGGAKGQGQLETTATDNRGGSNPRPDIRLE